MLLKSVKLEYQDARERKSRGVKKLNCGIRTDEQSMKRLTINGLSYNQFKILNHNFFANIQKRRTYIT